MRSRHAEFDFTSTRIALSKNGNLLAQLPLGNEHGPDNQRDVGTVEQHRHRSGCIRRRRMGRTHEERPVDLQGQPG
jgi:hypothetical protein